MTESLIEAAYLNVGTKNTNHKSRIWRDIDKHPLPDRHCDIDVKLKCGSILIGCRRRFWEKPDR